MKRIYNAPRLRVINVERLDTLCAGSTLSGGGTGEIGAHGEAKRGDMWYYMEEEE